MPKLIKNRAVIDDSWLLLRDASSLADVPAVDAVIVPSTLWLAERDALRARGNTGVWLAPADDPAALAGDLSVLPVVAVDFPKFVDGRGYSTARLLRDRYGYHGELRAIGDILRDQLYALAECGFDAFVIREDRNPHDALLGLRDFNGLYASTSRLPQPWFRRLQTAPAGDTWYPDL